MPGIVLSILHSLSAFMSIIAMLAFLFLHMKRRNLTQVDTASKLTGLVLKLKQSYFRDQNLKKNCGIGVRIWVRWNKGIDLDMGFSSDYRFFNIIF